MQIIRIEEEEESGEEGNLRQKTEWWRGFGGSEKEWRISLHPTIRFRRSTPRIEA